MLSRDFFHESNLNFKTLHLYGEHTQAIIFLHIKMLIGEGPYQEVDLNWMFYCFSSNAKAGKLDVTTHPRPETVGIHTQKQQP